METNQLSLFPTAKKAGRPALEPSSVTSLRVTRQDGTFRDYDLQGLDSRRLAAVLADLGHLVNYLPTQQKLPPKPEAAD